MRPAGWRLLVDSFDPELLAWSLIRVDDHHPNGEVWAGVIEDATDIRARVQDVQASLTNPITEALFARELGERLLPEPLRNSLSSAEVPEALTLIVRGWPARIPWDALAVDAAGTRVIERCHVLGGLAPGVVAGLADIDPSPAHRETLWLIDPGPPDGPWLPLFADGYPPAVRAARAPGDALLPDGLPFGPAQLARELGHRTWGNLAYLGHVVSNEQSPAGSALVLSDSNGGAPFTAHRWFQKAEDYPAPATVTLIGCGSDDAASFEQSGLPTAALHAGASLVSSTRWTLPNDQASLSLLRAVVTSQAHSGIYGLRHWKVQWLDLWRRTSAPVTSPFYWGSIVTYDRRLLLGSDSDE